ncbi:MAG TPA: hypothetical protein VLA09_11050 [Longimicrobiales bacterium]|nr:hypothetical protein [Longimicrobiales bacterium]
MSSRSLAVAVGFSLLALPADTESSARAPRPQEMQAARLVAFTNEPREPEFGEVFELRLTVRLAPGIVAFFPDTLLPAEDAFSAGSGAWASAPAPADSVDVQAAYPVMGLKNGGVELPSLELWIRPASGGETGGPVPVASLGEDGPSAAVGLQRLLIPIGGALIMPLRAMAEAADAGLVPQPPADVLGGEWSPWLIAAVAVLALTGGLLAWLLYTGRSAGVTEANRKASLPPRDEALRELDRILALGWHRNGRLVEFYASTTDVLRHFAERKDGSWRSSLTSTELLGQISERWGAEAVAGLRDAVWSAERVKFGTHRPAPDEAEDDWTTVRDWIYGLPHD